MEELTRNLLFAALVNGMTFGALFTFSRSSRRGLLFLGLFLVAYVGITVEWVIDDLPYLPINFYYAIMPLFFLYTRSVLGIFSKRLLWHLLPAVVEFVFFSVFLFDSELGDRFYTKENRTFIYITMVYLPPVFNMVYALLTLYTVRKARRAIATSYATSRDSNLNWILLTCVIVIADYLLEITGSVIEFTSQFDTYVFTYDAAATLFVVFWVSIFGIRQRFLKINELDTSVGNTPATPQEASVSASALPIEEFHRVERFFDETTVYTNVDANLFMIADLLKMSPRTLSRLVNTYAGKNFSQFIIDYRIRLAKELLKKPEYEKYNLLGLAREVGFSSRSSFFTNFKRIEGITPQEYRKASN